MNNQQQKNALPVPRYAVLRQFVPLLWRYRYRLLLAYGFSLLAVAAVAAAPWPLKFIIDYVLTDQAPPLWFENSLGGHTKHVQVLALAFSTALIAAIGAICLTAGERMNARIRERLARFMRAELLDRLLVMDMLARHKLPKGELTLRLVDDVHQVVRLLAKTLPLVARHVFTVVALLAVMLALEPRLGLAGIVITLVLALMIRGYAGSMTAAARSKRRHEGSVATQAQEIIRALDSVLATGREQWVARRFDASNVKSLRAGVEQTRVATGMQRSLQVANGIAMAVFAGLGGLLVLQGNFTIGTLTVYISYMVQLLKPVEKINELASAMSRGITRGERLLLLWKRLPPRAANRATWFLHDDISPLELRCVTFAYPCQERQEQVAPVLRNVDLRLEPGSATALLGASGAGKSTLLLLLLGLLDPTKGQLRVQDTPYRLLDKAKLRRQFAVMLQDTHLFAGSVRDNLCPPDKERSDEEIWRALRDVALEDMVKDLPRQLDAPLFEDGVNLSGGQRARLSLARAVLLDRPFLLLDEPLANVDIESQAIIIKALHAIKGQRTLLFITHQPELLVIADQILELKNGTLTTVDQHSGAKVRSIV